MDEPSRSGGAFVAATALWCSSDEPCADAGQIVARSRREPQAGWRPGVRGASLGECRVRRQHATLDELEAGATARADVRHAVGERELRERADEIAAADD